MHPRVEAFNKVYEITKEAEKLFAAEKYEAAIAASFSGGFISAGCLFVNEAMELYSLAGSAFMKMGRKPDSLVVGKNMIEILSSEINRLKLKLSEMKSTCKMLEELVDFEKESVSKE